MVSMFFFSVLIAVTSTLLTCVSFATAIIAATDSAYLTISVNIVSNPIGENCSSVDNFATCSLDTAWDTCINFIGSQDTSVISPSCEIILPENSEIEHLLSNGPLVVSDTMYLNGSISIVGNGATVKLINDQQNYTADPRFLVWDGVNGVDLVNNSNYVAGLMISNLTITGFGQSDTLSDGGAIYVSHITYFALSNVNITHNTGQNGGAVNLDSIMIVNIDNCTFTDNIAYQSGGALYITNDDDIINGITFYQISNSIFLTNTAGNSGGAIALSHLSNIFINDVIFDNCSASDSGGAVNVDLSNYLDFSNIYVAHTSTTSWSYSKAGGLGFYLTTNVFVSNVTMENVVAGNYGGGIDVERCEKFILKDISMQLVHTTSEYYGLGGGIRLYSSDDIILMNTSFATVSSGYGGALFSQYVTNIIIIDYSSSQTVASDIGGSMYLSSSQNISLFDVQIAEALTSLDGGGIFLSFSSSISIVDAIVKDVNALAIGPYDGGGGIFVYGCDTVYLSEVNVVNGYTGAYGGGISIELCSNVMITNVVATNNKATNGGGISLHKINSLTLSNVTLMDNFASFGGGSLLMVSVNNGVIQNVFVSQTIASNLPIPENGGGISIQYANSMIVMDIFVSNTSAVTRGGGVYVMSSKYMTITNVTVINCIASYGGGIAIINLDYVNISDISVVGNRNKLSTGGGCMHMEGTSSLTLVNGRFFDGYSSIGGCVNVVNSQSVKLTNFFVTSCIAELIGGGLAMTSSSDVTTQSGVISNCLSHGNGAGMAIIDGNDEIRMTNVTIASNVADNVGGGLYIDSENSHIHLMSQSSYQNMATFVVNYEFEKTFLFENATHIIMIFDKNTVFDTSEDGCCIYLKFIDSTGDVLLSIDPWSELPGISMIPFIIRGNQITIDVTNMVNDWLVAVNYQKMYFIPVYDMENDPARFQDHGAVIIRDNHGLYDGGGVLVNSFNLQTLFFNILITDNVAVDGNGGGMMLEVGNGNSIISGSLITNNQATEN